MKRTWIALPGLFLITISILMMGTHTGSGVAQMTAFVIGMCLMIAGCT